jgi:hypothetical protein
MTLFFLNKAIWFTNTKLTQVRQYCHKQLAKQHKIPNVPYPNRIRESGNQGIRESGNQGIRESGNQGIRESGNQGINSTDVL